MSARFSLLALALLAACSTAGLRTSPNGGKASGESTECFEEVEDCGGLDGGTRRDGGTSVPHTGDIPTSGSVSIQVQPTDAGVAILNAIKGAQTSVHMTIYLLTNNSIINALGDLAAAGKDVKVVLNRKFPGGPEGGDNQDAFDKLQAKGVDVVWAPDAFDFTHAKTIIVDQAKVIIMTMNLTFTSPTTNREYIATDSDPDDVETCEKIFQADFKGETIQVNSKLVISPSTANEQGRPRDQLKNLIDSAKDSLDVEVQTLSDVALVNAIIAKHKEGVPTRVVIDGDVSNSSAQLTAIRNMKAAGVALRSMSTPDVHAKVIVVDERRTFVGSQNFTGTALFDNREIGVITDAEGEAKKVRDTIARDFEAGTELP